MALRVRSLVVLVFVALASCGGSPTPASPRRPRAQAALPPLPWDAARRAGPAVRSPRIAIVGGTVLTAAGPRIENGVVLMEDGRIVAVGAADAIEIPEGAQTIDARGRFVTPGLIDTHSHMGVYPVPELNGVSDGNEATAPVTAGVRAADGFWPQDPSLARALAAGVTTIQVLPGSANLIGGGGIVLKLRPGRAVSDLEFPGAPDTLKMACGENPKRVYGGRNQAPSTRMGNVEGVRRAFQQAIEYGRTWRNWQVERRDWENDRREAAGRPADAGTEDPGPPPLPPARDFALERLLGAIEGRVLIQMHCYRADEMVRMIEVGRELGFRIRAFHHAVEAYKIRDILAGEGIGVSTWADWWGFKLEAYDAIEQNLALLTRAGVRGVVHSDSEMLVQRLNQEASKARAAGARGGIEVSEDEALRWITANAAWTLGIEERTGALRPGLMADVVVWSAHPFSVYARPDLVFVDGELAFDRSRPEPVRRTDFELGHDLQLEEAP